MQDDVTDGVKALIAQGIVDPKRVCIVGASYGGYAALAGAAFTPESVCLRDQRCGHIRSDRVSGVERKDVQR